MKFKYLTCLACAGVVLGVGSFAIDSKAAAPVSGIFEMTTTKCAVEKTSQDKDTMYSGVTLALNNALAGNATATVDANSNALVQTKFSSYEDVAICVAEDKVNVRSQADENSDIVGKISKNAAAAIVAMEGDWYKISSGTVVGYVKRQYMDVGNADLAKSVSKRLCTVNAETVEVYDKPEAGATGIAKYPKGEVLAVVDESLVAQGWVEVSTENGDGYIQTANCTLTTEYNLAESKAEEEARLAKEEAERQAAAAAFMKAAQKQAQQKAAQSAKAKASTSGGSARSYAPPSGGNGSAVVAYGSQFVGNPYVYGGTSLTNGADCSGFVMSVYSNYGVSLPHSSYAMANCGYAVSPDEMQPGDLVIYSGHVGIYAGDGQLLHASNPRTGITYSNVNYRPIQTVRRVY